MEIKTLNVEVLATDLRDAMRSKADDLDRQFRSACADDALAVQGLTGLRAMWAKLTGNWPNTHQEIDDSIGLLMEDFVNVESVISVFGPEAKMTVHSGLVVALHSHWREKLP